MVDASQQTIAVSSVKLYSGSNLRVTRYTQDHDPRELVTAKELERRRLRVLVPYAISLSLPSWRENAGYEEAGKYDVLSRRQIPCPSGLLSFGSKLVNPSTSLN
jgi:hypothetical protein